MDRPFAVGLTAGFLASPISTSLSLSSDPEESDSDSSELDDAAFFAAATVSASFSASESESDSDPESSAAFAVPFGAFTIGLDFSESDSESEVSEESDVLAFFVVATTCFAFLFTALTVSDPDSDESSDDEELVLAADMVLVFVDCVVDLTLDNFPAAASPSLSLSEDDESEDDARFFGAFTWEAFDGSSSEELSELSSDD